MSANIDDRQRTAIISNFERCLLPCGFEVKPFLIGWYNDLVAKEFKLKYSYDTLALNVISTPTMFEKTFLEYVRRCDFSDLEGERDIMDVSIKRRLCEVRDEVETVMKLEEGVEMGARVVCDYEMNNVTRRPLIVVRTAGHVAGHVRYYRPEEAVGGWMGTLGGKKIHGCSLHHRYGGWFAFRAVVILERVPHPALPREDPPDPLCHDPALISRLLEEYNLRWQSWSFRDLVAPSQRYSGPCIRYLSLPPGTARLALLKRWWPLLRADADLSALPDRDDDLPLELLTDAGM